MNYQFTVTALTKVKKILSFKNVRIDSNTDTFKEMYDAIKKDLFFTRNVRVYVGKIDNKWRRRVI
uniref:Uncharacterized protein n=1 Tax=Rhizophagus irregularis (strain DAOM 181602 / DAOM 197198 / MUCL 43194) TaxID=747089 RepID=U9SXN2_RHIID